MNSLQEAYLKIYQSQLDEAMSEDEKEMRRLAAQERRAGNSDRMDAKVAKKYADSESKSAERADKKSKGKHIHGMADSYEMDGEQIDEISAQLAHTASMKADYERGKAAVAGDTKRAAEKARQASAIYKGVGKRRAKEKMQNEENVNEIFGLGGKSAKDRLANSDYMKKKNKEADEKAVQNLRDMMSKDPERQKRPSRINNEEVELDERALDATEKKEKERLVKAMKKSASDFKKRYGERAKSVMYATATKQAKERMDTSKSDRRYGVER